MRMLAWILVSRHVSIPSGWRGLASVVLLNDELIVDDKALLDEFLLHERHDRPRRVVLEDLLSEHDVGEQTLDHHQRLKDHVDDLAEQDSR